MKGTKGLVLLYSYNLVLKDFEVKQVSRETKKGPRYWHMKVLKGLENKK